MPFRNRAQPSQKRDDGPVIRKHAQRQFADAAVEHFADDLAESRHRRLVSPQLPLEQAVKRAQYRIPSLEADQPAQLAVAVNRPGLHPLKLRERVLHKLVERLRAEVVRYPVAERLDPGPHAGQGLDRKRRHYGDRGGCGLWVLGYGCSHIADMLVAEAVMLLLPVPPVSFSPCSFAIWFALFGRASH